MNTLFTFGYSGRGLSELSAYAQMLNALVLDIRIQPYSQMATWRKDNLKAYFGKNYLHLEHLGNINYLGGEIEIKNLEVGFSILAKQLAQQNVVLLCGCGDHRSCHRSTVATHAQTALNVQVVHLPDQENYPIPSTYPAGFALSIKQPWAWLLANGYKDIENRTWYSHYRGQFMIHAGVSFDKEGYKWVRHHFPKIEMPAIEEFETGGIVGIAKMVDCVTKSNSGWFFGPFGFKIADAQNYPFQPLKGQLKFFKV